VAILRVIQLKRDRYLLFQVEVHVRIRESRPACPFF